jgi:hypothetical protein
VASNNGAVIEESWTAIRQNPVFRRTLLPRGIAFLTRSPLCRAVGFSAVAILCYEGLLRILPVVWPIFFLAVLFWFLIYAVQRYFCWFELKTLAATGTLGDYLNSGLTRDDVLIGVIFPEVLARRLAALLVILWFLVSTGNDRGEQIFLIVLALLCVVALVRSPELFLPDVEDYFRKRNVLALFFVSFSTLVPLLIWFALYWAFFFGLVLSPLPITGRNASYAAFALTYFTSRFPIGWWQTWRLKRFYRRQRSTGDLLDGFLGDGR